MPSTNPRPFEWLHKVKLVLIAAVLSSVPSAFASAAALSATGFTGIQATYDAIGFPPSGGSCGSVGSSSSCGTTTFIQAENFLGRRRAYGEAIFDPQFMMASAEISLGTSGGIARSQGQATASFLNVEPGKYVLEGTIDNANFTIGTMQCPSTECSAFLKEQSGSPGVFSVNVGLNFDAGGDFREILVLRTSADSLSGAGGNQFSDGHLYWRPRDSTDNPTFMLPPDSPSPPPGLLPPIISDSLRKFGIPINSELPGLLTPRFINANANSPSPVAIIDSVESSAPEYVYGFERLKATKFIVPDALPITGDDMFEVEYQGITRLFSAGELVDFTVDIPGGVDSFIFRGFDAGENLATSQPFPYEVGLQFDKAGVARVYHAVVNVPEPNTLPIALLCLCLVLVFIRFRRAGHFSV